MPRMGMILTFRSEANMEKEVMSDTCKGCMRQNINS